MEKIEEISSKNNFETMEKLFTTSFLTEEEVGIEEFLSKNFGFDCILKHRYNDFLVNEIDYNGNVVWAEIPPAVDDKSKENSYNDLKLKEKREEKKEVSRIYIEEESLKNILLEFSILFGFDNEELSGIKTLVEKNNCKNLKSDEIKLRYLDDKQKRKMFHEKLRENFPFLDSTTDKDCLRVFKNKGEKQTRSFITKPKNVEGSFIECTLLKRNTDTQQAINYLAKFLRKSGKTIRVAGNKDKRGITTQKITVNNVELTEIERMRVSRDGRLELSGFKFTENETYLGNLQGNQFSVCLRFIKDESTCISNIESLKKLGFINYFGMQRFGSGHVPTHLIGKYVVLRQWKEVCCLIIQSQSVLESLKEANIKLNSLDELLNSAELMKKLRLNYRAHTENKIIEGLKINPGNYSNAFKSLNRQLRLIYPHAYQSYIWNKAVSFRLKKGLELIEGDIVLKKDKNFKEEIEEIIDENDNKLENNFELVTKDNKSIYTIYDLYLPLVGLSTCFPQNDTGEFMKDLLFKDGINWNKDDLGPGSYRKVLQIPTNVSYDFVLHDDPDEELQSEYYNEIGHPKTISGDKHLSLRLIFQVPPSCYATMLFREITHRSSAFSYQSELTKNIQKKEEDEEEEV